MTKTIYYDDETKITRKIIKYTIQNKEYYLATNILTHRAEYYKDLYWNRWCIEVHFRESKYFLSLTNLKSTALIKIKQDIYVHQFIFIIAGYIKNNLRQYIDTCHKINSKLLIHSVVCYLLRKLLYCNFGKENIQRVNTVMDYLVTSTNPIRNNRNYPRRRIKPVSKFYYC